MILYSNKNKKLHLTESQISRLLENYEDEAFKRTEQYIIVLMIKYHW